jgi:hypothetical protein
MFIRKYFSIRDKQHYAMQKAMHLSYFEVFMRTVNRGGFAHGRV